MFVGDDGDDEGMNQALALSVASYNQEQQYASSSSGPHNLFDDIFSELREETFEQEERAPRGFQQELFNTVLQDHHNYIIFAPTGCGKTFIASKIAKYYLEQKASQGGKGTVLFIVDRIPLVLQQAAAIKVDIGSGWNISKYCGELGAIENWQMETSISHVLVLTAQILVNCLVVNPGGLSDVDLLIFDECHHTTKEHPYNRIVRDHWKVLPARNRPKIVGLTASPGGHVDLAKTETKIHNLCENMHSKIIMVKENTEELKSVLSSPKVELIDIVLDPYLVQLVGHLDKLISKIEGNARDKHRFRYTWPENKTSAEYMRFCEQILRDRTQARPVRSACGLNLMIANCIQLLEDVGLESVINYLTTLQRSTEWPTETSQLLQLFRSRYSPNLTHGKRDTLVRKLKALSVDKGFKRGIIFAKTRASAYAILDLVEKLRAFKPCVLVGHGAGSDSGMKLKSQQRSVKEFNDGSKNLMIATSVAEEGLDIQACNTVIRYDALNTAEALIQSRGRARFHDSSFVVLLSCNSAERTAFYHALESEKNMHTIVKRIQEKPGIFYDFLHKHGQHSTTSTSSNNHTSSSSSRDLASSACSLKQPTYNITPTPRGFVGDGTVTIQGTPVTTKEVYGATEREVKALLEKEIVKLLFDFGELEGVDFQNLRLSTPIPLPQAPIISSAIPRGPSFQPQSSLPSSSSYNSYPGNYATPRAIMPATATTTSKPASSTAAKSPPAGAVIKVTKALDAKNKTAVQYLFEWCQDKKYPPPSKTCNTVAPFFCTIQITNIIKYIGPKNPSKKGAEQAAATHVLAILEVF